VLLDEGRHAGEFVVGTQAAAAKSLARVQANNEGGTMRVKTSPRKTVGLRDELVEKNWQTK
jgi:hypothetical protein